MPRSLVIEYDYEDDFAVITPVKRCDLEAFNFLLSYLFQTWQAANYQINSKGKIIMMRISSLVPRLDIPGKGIDIELLNTESLESLFLGEVVNNELLPCKLMKLQEFKAPTKKKSKKKPGEILTPEDVPIPSSGIEEADILATLISVDDSVDGALALYRNLDAHMLNAVISHLNELRRDPKDRFNEYLNEQFEEWKKENQQAYQSAIFG